MRIFFIPVTIADRLSRQFIQKYILYEFCNKPSSIHELFIIEEKILLLSRTMSRTVQNPTGHYLKDSKKTDLDSLIPRTLR